MIISNPIFDAPFGKLTENEKAVKFFIGSILGKQAELVALQSEELDDTDEPRLPVFHCRGQNQKRGTKKSVRRNSKGEKRTVPMLFQEA